MMSFRRIASLMLGLLLAIGFVPAFAQDDGAETDPLEDLSQFEGIEFGVSRSWSVDFEAMMQITPTNDEEDPFASMTGMFLLGGFVMEFDGDDNAGSGFDLFNEMGEESLMQDMSETATLEREEVDDVGDEAVAFNVVEEAEEFGGTFRYLIIREGEYLLMALAAGSTLDDAALADEFAENMLDNLDDQSGLGEFNEDGTSTGGLWDVFPSSDHEMFDNLVPVGDEIIYPEPEEEEI